MTLTWITTTLTWDGSLSQLIPQIQGHLHTHGTPLRWAITAVNGRELSLEAVVVQDATQWPEDTKTCGGNGVINENK
ncbi:hypothetical protein [Gloeomargarita lithophora]|uniref:hypothetical protein n=1 Tax=Gloeomargarita lithophora TaxID=1188228 RepID=UPI0008F8A310|nr:hypothetical protein [Gloeomargarita lithophora]